MNKLSVGVVAAIAGAITAFTMLARAGAGMPVEATGIAGGCMIASVVANTSITLNSSACVTSSGTSTVTVFLTGYGSGGSSSTIGAPDCRGRVIAGRDRNDPGSFANRLTSSWFGADSSIFNKAGGAESQTLTLAQLPTGIASANASQNISVTVASASIAYDTSTLTTNTAPGAVGQILTNGRTIGPLSSSGTTPNAISVTSNNTSGSAHPIVQPTLIAECVVRVIP
jgi:hypothetical protein